MAFGPEFEWRAYPIKYLGTLIDYQLNQSRSWFTTQNDEFGFGLILQINPSIIQKDQRDYLGNDNPDCSKLFSLKK